MTPLIICCVNNCAQKILCTKCSVNIGFLYHFLPDLITIIAINLFRIYFFVLNLAKHFFL